jgi:hypothetical protein
MAKPFYSMEEVCEKLGKTEDAVKALVRDGALREFRDAGKVFFKSDEVEKLGGGRDRSGDSDEITLEPADDDNVLSDDPGGGTSVLGLAPVGDEPNKPNKKEGTVISASGIGVFDDDELEIDADPLAATHVSADMGDQINLDGSGGGSGLLDLTRESDDTSLGAELLDEIYPGEEETADATPAEPTEALDDSDASAMAQETEAEEFTAPVAITAPRVTASGDTTEGMFAGLAAGSVILLALAGSVGASALQGFYPDYASWLTNKFWFFLGGAALLPILCLLVGWVAGRASAR